MGASSLFQQSNKTRNDCGFYGELFKNSRLNEKENGSMIVIDGVVGVGKSTLMDILAEANEMVKFEEPVIDNPILSKFYHDKKRYSFPLQVFFLNKRFEHIKKASLERNAILDRSIYGDVIFAKMLMDSGDMSREEFDIYMDLFQNMLEHVVPPRLMVYLEISTDEAVNRINKRGRDYELITDKSYWEDLNKNYQSYFEDYNFSPILKINVDSLDFESNPEDKEYVLNLIYRALGELELKKAS